MKASASRQKIYPRMVATRSVRAGGAEASYQAEGHHKTKLEGGRKTDCAQQYMDLASRDPKKTARMVSSATTNAQNVEAYRVSNSFRVQQPSYYGDDATAQQSTVVHGAEYEDKLRGMIGASCADGGLTSNEKRKTRANPPSCN